MDAKLEKLLSQHGGAVRACELIKADCDKAMLRVAVLNGDIAKHDGGVLALPETPQWWVRARAQGADVGCVSAAIMLGLWVLEPPELLHATTTGNWIDEPIVCHRRRADGLIGVLKQCCACLPEIQALVIVESAVVKQLVTLAQLKTLCRRRGNPAFRKVVELVNPSSESILETFARYLLVKAGYVVQTQKYVAGLGRLDLLVEGVLGIEVDGREHHSSDREFAEDRRRGNLATIKGLRVLRVTYELVMHRPEEFLDLVNRAVASCRAA